MANFSLKYSKKYGFFLNKGHELQKDRAKVS